VSLTNTLVIDLLTCFKLNLYPSPPVLLAEVGTDQVPNPELPGSPRQLLLLVLLLHVEIPVAEHSFQASEAHLPSLNHHSCMVK